MKCEILNFIFDLFIFVVLFLFSNGKCLLSILVVFYVYMFVIEILLSIYYIFVFNVIKINIGGGYNKYSGMFLVFVVGVYVLIWIIYFGDNGKIVFGIFVNDDMVCSIFGEINDVDYDYDFDIGVIVVLLN